MKEAGAALLYLQTQLVDAYRTAEQGSEEIGHNVAEALSEEFGKTLLQLADFYEDTGIQVVDLRLDDEQVLSQKRARDSESNVSVAATDTPVQKPAKKTKLLKVISEYIGPALRTRSKGTLG